MKGYFSLNYDYYSDVLQFGNLDPDMGTLGELENTTRDDTTVPRLIAHDVVEHSVKHRTSKYISYEEELRALGAIDFVRGEEGFDLYDETFILIADVQRTIKSIPKIICDNLTKTNNFYDDLEDYLIERGIKSESAKNAAYQYAWGNKQKSDQFGNDRYKARNAFRFIEQAAKSAIECIQQEDFMCSGVSTYFDTSKHTIRHQMKRKF